MANNRLYFGNTETKEYIFLEKGWGCGWEGGWFDGELIRLFISNAFHEGEIGQDTNLIFFTEYSKCFDDFVDNGKQITKDSLIP